jgi:hypothetical protein
VLDVELVTCSCVPLIEIAVVVSGAMKLELVSCDWTVSREGTATDDVFGAKSNSGSSEYVYEVSLVVA